MKIFENLQCGFKAGCLAGLLLPTALSHAVLPVTDGLILDLRLDQATIEEGLVTAINDMSGLGNHAGGGVSPMHVASATPTGLDAMNFNGLSQYLEVGSSSDFDGRAKTTFVVFRPESLGVGRMINSAFTTLNPDNPDASAHYSVGSAFANSAGGGVFRIQNRTLTGGAVAVSTPNQTVSTGSFFIGVNLWEDSGGITAIILNEEGERSIGMASGATANPQGHIWTRIGANAGTGNPNPQDYFHGDVAAVLVFNRALDAAELSLVEGYLYQTYIPEPGTVSLVFGLLACLTVLMWKRRGKS